MTASTIVIRYNGTDITSSCIFSRTSFESLAAAQPGTCEITVKDPNQTMSFVTGKSLSLTVDGTPLWTGYLTSVTRTFAFPVVDTTTPANVDTRLWTLRGVDLNILFDKRIVHNSANHTQGLPFFDVTRYDGDLISNVLTGYLDISGDSLDTSTYVDDVLKPGDPFNDGLTGTAAWPYDQGTPWRDNMSFLALFSGAVYYIDASRNLHYHAYETVDAAWGFSDVPDGTTTIGFRDLDLVEDGSVIVNDAMIWGGSEWADDGTIVFAREENATSISEHGRWQTAETHFGQAHFKLQSGVDARAAVIVNGAPGAVVGTLPGRGLRFPQYDLSLSWFSTDVPSAQHLKCGDIVTTNLYVMGSGGSPLVLALPLRRIRMSFPTLDGGTGDAYIRFDGSMSLQLSDPKGLWTYLRSTQRSRERTATLVGTATDTSTTASYGTLFSGNFNASPDGSTTAFSINFPYIAGTTQVYVDGLLIIPGVDYTESSPTSGQITFSSAPSAAAGLWMICRLA